MGRVPGGHGCFKFVGNPHLERDFMVETQANLETNSRKADAIGASPCDASAGPVTISTAMCDTYTNNLAALAIHQPKAKDLLECAAIPASAQPAAGRDGQPTFVWKEASNRYTWFGGSSMPRISAAAIFGKFISDGRNVWLPGIMTGAEVLEVARRLPAHTAIFVVERDATLLKIALHLYDYADLFAPGRLVLIMGDLENLEHAAIDFFDRHPGYELPIHLLPTPMQSNAEISALQARIQSAGNTLVTRQNKALATIAADLRNTAVPLAESQPRVAVMSVDPRPATLRQGQRLARACRQLGWTHETCMPDTPERCHLLARMATIQRLMADFVLMANSDLGGLNSLLPNNFPTAVWHLPESSLAHSSGSTTDAAEQYFVVSKIMRDRLVEQGIPKDHIDRLEVAADVCIFRALDPSDMKPLSQHIDVAIVHDLPDDRAESSGITLPSHQRLWRAIQQSAHDLTTSSLSIPPTDVLTRAEHNSGIRLTDTQMRDRFLSLIGERVLPVMAAQREVLALMKAGYLVGAWGANWNRIAPTGVPICELIPDDESLNQIFNASKAIVFPYACPVIAQRALDALASGARVFVRRGPTSFERSYPGLADVAPFLHSYRTVAELVKRLPMVMNDPHREQAVAVIHNRHTVAHRLTDIFNRIRSTHGALPCGSH